MRRDGEMIRGRCFAVGMNWDCYTHYRARQVGVSAISVITDACREFVVTRLSSRWALVWSLQYRLQKKKQTESDKDNSIECTSGLSQVVGGLFM